MNTDIQDILVNSSITFTTVDNVFVALNVVTLTLIKQQTTLIECCLTLSLNSELYQDITTKSLFNLKSEILNVSSKPNFQPTSTVQLEISLKLDRLKHLQAQAKTAEEVTGYLVTLNNTEPNHPLFHTENWLALSVKQNQENGGVGYRTLWSYLRPSTLAQLAESGNGTEISEAISTFFKDWTESHLSAVTQKTTLKALDGFTQFLDKIADTAIDSFVEAATSKQSVFEAVCDFFKQEKWPFIKLPNQTTLQLLAQAKNGQWTCYATIREAEKIFAFYSVCPVPASKTKRKKMAEFIARANYSLIVGNFELDFNDGEIRYKTSIDVEGDRLTTVLIRNLVYTNVLTMDQYLPGILAVLEQGATPEEAINLVESAQAQESV